MKNLLSNFIGFNRRSSVLQRTAVTAMATLCWLGGSSQNLVGAAQGFNVFVKNNLTLSKDKSYGPVAAGGDLTITDNFKFAHKDGGTFKVGNLPIGLVVGGKINYMDGDHCDVEHGYVKVGNLTGTTVWYTDDKGKNDVYPRLTKGAHNEKPYIEISTKTTDLGVSALVNPVWQASVIDFAQAFTLLQANAVTASQYASNVALSNANNTKTGTTISSVVTNGQVNAAIKPGVNVLTVTGAELNSVTSRIDFSEGPSQGKVLVVNVNAPGTFAWNVWDQKSVNNHNAPYIIYNFYNTTNLKIEGSKPIFGTVLAPFANITKTINPDYIEGQVIGLSLLHGGGEFRNENFTASVTPAAGAPTEGADEFKASNVSLTSMKIKFKKGNGTGRIVIAQKGSTPLAPANGQEYTANSKMGAGAAIGNGFVVYNGTDNEVTVTGLEAGTTYHYLVVEYNTLGAAIAYGTSLTLEGKAATQADKDNDEVPDEEDEFPDDADKAFSNQITQGYSTLLFEDQWPYKGDYDFNDLVLDYRLSVVTNAKNNIAEMHLRFVPRACGATSRNGFAFQLDGISPNAIKSVSGTKMAAGWTTLNNNGTEAGHPAHANVVVFDNAFKMFKNVPAGETMINTWEDAPHYASDTITVVIVFHKNAVSHSALSAMVFNPYLIVDQTRGREIHLNDRLPSAKMNTMMLGTGDDRTNAARGIYFKTAANLPWALNIATSVPHAMEQVDFTDAYLRFSKWAATNGLAESTWYVDDNGKRDLNKLYKKK